VRLRFCASMYVGIIAKLRIDINDSESRTLIGTSVRANQRQRRSSRIRCAGILKESKHTVIVTLYAYRTAGQWKLGLVFAQWLTRTSDTFVGRIPQTAGCGNDNFKGGKSPCARKQNWHREMARVGCAVLRIRIDDYSLVRFSNVLDAEGSYLSTSM